MSSLVLILLMATATAQDKPSFDGILKTLQAHVEEEYPRTRAEHPGPMYLDRESAEAAARDYGVDSQDLHLSNSWSGPVSSTADLFEPDEYGGHVLVKNGLLVKIAALEKKPDGRVSILYYVFFQGRTSESQKSEITCHGRVLLLAPDGKSRTEWKPDGLSPIAAC